MNNGPPTTAEVVWEQSQWLSGDQWLHRARPISIAIVIRAFFDES